MVVTSASAFPRARPHVLFSCQHWLRTARRAATASLGALLALPAVALAQPQPPAARLDSLFSLLHRQHQFSGVVLVADKGQVVFQKGYGYRDERSHRKNTLATVFELASCSKQFTAAGIVLLKRQGKLRYEDKLTTYLPELASWGQVTLYDLLRHTSGLPEYLVDLPQHWHQHRIATNRDLLAFYAARQDTLEFAPGRRHRYSNTNYALLASIIERVSGRSYADFLAEQLFRPLGMRHSFVYSRRLQPRRLPNYATGYVWARGSFRKVVPEDAAYGDSLGYVLDGIVGNAKVHSTAPDLFKWLTALRHNTLLTQAEFDQMTKVTQTTGGQPIPYGFGLDLAKGPGKFSFGHTGSWDGYATFVYHHVGKDRTIITLQNFRLGTYSFRNITQVLDGQPLTVEYKQRLPLAAQQLQRYAGTYVSETDPTDAQVITCLEGHLVHNSARIPWDMRFFPVSDTEFQAIRQGGTDGVLRFTTLADGRIKLEMFQYGEKMGGGLKAP